MATEHCTTRTVGSAGSETSQLAISGLEAVAKELCEASLAKSSNKTYKAAQKLFSDFCSSCRRPPVLASEQLVILFVADLSLRVYSCKL